MKRRLWCWLAGGREASRRALTEWKYAFGGGVASFAGALRCDGYYFY